MIQTYHRPSTIEDALALLGAGDAAVLAGGTSLIASGEATTVVDLQDIGLDGIALDGERISIGAMVRLRDLVESDLVPPVLRELARREAPSTIRNAATIGGTIASADPESELLAGLLVHDTTLTIAGDAGTERPALSDYLADRPGGIITEISIAAGGVAAPARTGRTPADRPIVMAVARRGPDNSVSLALTGVGPTPVLVDPSAVADLDPPADFRGSSEYRAHLARILSSRAIAGLDG